MNTEYTLNNENWITAVFEHSNHAILLIDNKLNFIQVNSGAVKLLGYSKKEFLDMHLNDHLVEDCTEIVQSLMFGGNQKECRHLEQTGFRKKNGEILTCKFEISFNVLPELHLIILSDISEQKKLKEQIAAEQLRFQRMYQEAPVTMCILKGKEHVFDSANNNYYKVYGRSENIIGKPVREVFPEVNGQGYFDWLDNVYETGKTFSGNETPLKIDVNGDGLISDFYINFIYQAYRNEYGNIEGIFFFGVDVTEQVLARKKVEESEKQYYELIENLPAAVYTTDTKGHIKIFNKAAAELWGRSPDLEKDRWCGSWKIFDLDKNEISHDQCIMAEKIKFGKLSDNKEALIQKPDGSYRNILPHTAFLKDKSGEITGGVNVFFDITEKKKIEEKLRRLSLIAQKTDNSVMITNTEGRIIWVNQGFLNTTEFSENEAIGKKPEKLLHGAKTDLTTQDFILRNFENKHSWKCEILKYKKSKTPYWVESKGQPLFDSEGNLTSYFIIESDITSKKEAYERLVIAEDQVRIFARQLNIMLEAERARIAREIHDEFGQQLNGLKMSLSYLEKISSNNQKIKDLAVSMKNDVDESLHSLREFATELRPGILDTLGLTDSLNWMIKEFEKKSNIQCTFSTNIPDSEFDSNMAINVFRICQEALTNVLKHSKAKNISIRFEDFKEKIILSISDDGVGILLEAINQPFSLGLLGMRERAKLINGELQIINAKGTTIELRLNKNDKDFNS